MAKRATPLSAFGIDAYGWSREDAIDITVYFTNQEIDIIGGDVFHYDGQSLSPLYANWYVEPTVNESSKEFSQRCIQEALEFLNNFPQEIKIPHLLFTLAFSEPVPELTP